MITYTRRLAIWGIKGGANDLNTERAPFKKVHKCTTEFTIIVLGKMFYFVPGKVCIIQSGKLITSSSQHILTKLQNCYSGMRILFDGETHDCMAFVWEGNFPPCCNLATWSVIWASFDINTSY